MKLKTLAIPVLLALFLAGCSTPQMTDGQLEALSKDTFTISCTGGCEVAYTDPRDRPQMPTNGWDTANTAINAVSGVITSTAPWAAITLTGMDAISNAGGNDSSSVNNVDNSSQDTSSVDNSYRDNSVVNLPSPPEE